jgi:hypothetical protein
MFIHTHQIEDTRQQQDAASGGEWWVQLAGFGYVLHLLLHFSCLRFDDPTTELIGSDVKPLQAQNFS